MQVFRPVDYAPATLVGAGLRILLATANPGVADRLARLGGTVEVEAELFVAIGAIIDDPHGWGLFVIDADGLGGLDEARRVVNLIRADRPMLPVIILSGEVGGQVFPEDPAEPVLLRGPTSAVSLRVGVEHALRDRLVWAAA
jgi:hypothetical protein